MDARSSLHSITINAATALLGSALLGSALLGSALLTSSAAAQSSRPGTSPPSSRAPVTTAPGGASIFFDPMNDERQRPRRLLREGSQLVQVTGIVHREASDGTWTFTIDAGDGSAPRYDLTLMPSSLLGDMEQMIETAPGDHLVFEMTGQVYVYRERNYLMPTHPPLLVGQEVIAETVVSPADDDDAPGGDSTSDIIRDLERAVGAVPRRGAGDRRAPFGVSDGDGTVAGPALEGTILVERRGVIRRTGGGAYIVVFDADAEGNADPPMRLLPCLLLESLQQYARNHGERTSVLISGHVYTYRGLNYLRPTLFRIPLDRTRLQP